MGKTLHKPDRAFVERALLVNVIFDYLATLDSGRHTEEQIEYEGEQLLLRRAAGQITISPLSSPAPPLSPRRPRVDDPSTSDGA